MPASPPAPQASPGVDAFETANADSLAYVESLYEQYLDDPAAVPDAWRDRFASLNGAAARQGNGHGPSHPASTKGFRTTPRFTPPGLFGSASPPPAQGDGHADPNHGSPLPGAIAVGELTDASLQHRVDMLIRNYRVRGHIIAQLDPLGTRETPPPELDPDFYGFSEADYDRPFFYSTSLDGRGRTQTLRQIIDSMRSTYCGDIGVQFMHIDNLAVRQWLQERMEGSGNRVELSRKEQVRILTRLTDAVVFEEFIQRKFIGAKSFSLEGAESLIPLLDLAFERTGDQGVQEIVIGMAHRGRLNVLANILGKSPQKIFREFEDMDPELYLGGGDVKYHLGYSGDWRTRSGRNIHLSLCFNPSHLEFVNPVAMGRLRAKQDATGRDSRGEGGMCLLIHGDAAFAGEGIVQETLNMSSLPGYTVGGTLHIIINNQIGFTTGPKEARSTRYATDVARMLQSPIFHVNGERPEAVAAVVNLAAPGEFVVIVGPSGCGKSTLLRIVAGLEPLTGGRIVLGGRDVSAVPAAKRGLAMVFQSYALYPHKTVAQNMGFALKIAGERRIEIDRRVAEAARVLQLEPLLDRKPAALSGGQRQRVAIGRCIVRHPEVFLFDEPLSNLDAALRSEMRVELGELHQRLGATMLYVTHDQVEAMTLADKIVVLREGHVQQVGTPKALYARPDNLFVAGFIGSPAMNFVDGEIGANGFRGPGLSLPLDIRGRTGRCKLGIRPEHVALSDEPGLPAMKIDLVEYLGDESVLYGQLPDGTPFTVKAKGEVTSRAGDAVGLRVDPAAAHLFDPDGLRVEAAPTARIAAS